MQQHICEVPGCSELLNALSEIATGLCIRHQIDLDRRFKFAGVCWNCGKITVIDDKPRLKGEILLTEKFIFSKDCSKCSEKSVGINWMTIKKGDFSEVALGSDETLALDKGYLVIHSQNKGPVRRDGAAGEFHSKFTLPQTSNS
jgi:hypothetical protein